MQKGLDLKRREFDSVATWEKYFAELEIKKERIVDHFLSFVLLHNLSFWFAVHCAVSFPRHFAFLFQQGTLSSEVSMSSSSKFIWCFRSPAQYRYRYCMSGSYQLAFWCLCCIEQASESRSCWITTPFISWFDFKLFQNRKEIFVWSLPFSDNYWCYRPPYQCRYHYSHQSTSDRLLWC